MSNTVVTVLVWSAVAAHLAVLAMWRRSAWNLPSLLNLAMGLVDLSVLVAAALFFSLYRTKRLF